MTALFLVTSPGYTATKWLAWSLNGHPGVYCNHSAGSDVLHRDYTLEELAALAADKHERRDETPLDDFFARLLERAGGAAAAGNVHRYNLTALNRNLARFGRPRPFRAVNLLRHPVPWVESGTRQLGQMYGAAPVVRRRLEGHFRRHRALYRALGAPTFPWPSELAFCYLCGRLERLAAELSDGSVRHVRMEDITRDPDALRALIGSLTGLDPDAAAIRRALGSGPIHQHRPAAPDAAAQLEVWSAWQRTVFDYWARRSGVVAAYAHYGYELPADLRLPGASGAALPPAPSREREGEQEGAPEHELFVRGPSVAPRRTIRRALEGSFDAVASREVRFERLLEPRLRRTLAALRRRLEEAGLARGHREPETSYLSPGLDGGAAPLLEPGFFAGGGWRAGLVHPPRHDRSPALVCHHPESHLVVNLKGAGIRSLRDSFVVRAGRCPAYRATLERDRHKPVDILIDHPDGEWASHELVGGAQLWPTLMEIRHALAWHALLLAHDRAPAATCVPLGVARPLEAPVRIGARRQTVPIEELFASPELSTPAQLRQVLRDIHPLRRLTRPLAVARFARLLRRDPDALASSRHTALRRRVGRLYVRAKRPVVYEHATRGKLRVGHVWEQVVRDREIRARLDELGEPHDAGAIRALVDALVTEIYACHGHRPALPGEGPSAEPVLRASGRFAYLRAVYEANRASADAILDSVGRTGGRTLGALHGTGGHCLGRRIKVRDARGEPLRDGVGLSLRAGAPGGGCTTKRNMTVCGEWVDTAHVFNPAADPLSRLFAWLSRSHDRWLPWASPRAVDRFQRCDVELAEESMARFDALMTGRRELVPPELDRLDALRRERKRLEDTLRATGSREPSMVEAIEELEARAAALRRALPEYEAGRALRAFRDAYEAHRRQAEPGARRGRTGRSPRPGASPSSAPRPGDGHRFLTAPNRR